MFKSMRPGPWDISGLEELCSDILHKKSLVVEVGSYLGESTEVFARYSRHVVAIDPWRNVTENLDGKKFNYKNMRAVERQFDKRMSKYKNVIKIRGRSIPVSQFFADASLDFVYIDSLHDYDTVLTDLKVWLPKVKVGAYIGGHNYMEDYIYVRRAVGEMFLRPHKVYPDSSWIVKTSA